MNYVLAKNKYGDFYVPESSCANPCSRTIIGGNVWEQKTLEFIIEHHNNLPIVHAGTYFGDFLPALKDVKKIYAFEPNPENYEFAKKNIQLNKLTNVSLMFSGLGEQSEQLDFVTTKQNGKAAGGQSRFAVGEASIKVPVVRLDDIVKEKISILQLDVEGFELPALKGAAETISKYKPILILETAPEKAPWFQENIIGVGYEKIGRCDANTIWKI